jgi:ribonuclease P protein component
MRTITAAREIDRLFTEGRRAADRDLLVLIAPTPGARDPHGRVLFVAGKRLGSAVLRNRCKRVMRAAVDRVGGPWPGWDVALIARSGTATAAPSALDGALKAATRGLESPR